MKRVCFLLGGFQGNGGIGRVTSILINQLSRNSDLEIHAIVYYHDQRPILYNLDTRVHMHILYTTYHSMMKAMLFYRAVGKVRKIVEKENIDILIACGALFFPLCIASCLGLKAKCVCWEHTNPATVNDYKFQRICRYTAVLASWKIVVLTKSARKFYLTHYQKCENKVIQIYNPIDPESIKSKKYDEDSKKIISVGRLEYPKNFERLIEIASILLPRYPEWSWDIYGDGELRNKLSELVRENGLEQQLHLMGQNHNLYDVYPYYSFMVMTSRYEGFPMSLIEGAANRLPLISFDIQTGPNEIIKDGLNGFLVENNSNKKMIQRIEQLITQKDRRVEMSKNVIKLVEEFSLKRIVAQWLEVFNKEV